MKCIGRRHFDRFRIVSHFSCHGYMKPRWTWSKICDHNNDTVYLLCIHWYFGVAMRKKRKDKNRRQTLHSKCWQVIHCGANIAHRSHARARIEALAFHFLIVFVFNCFGVTIWHEVASQALKSSAAYICSSFSPMQLLIMRNKAWKL